MMLTEQQQLELIDLCKKMKEMLDSNNKLLAQGEQRLNTNTEILRQSNEDIQLLLAFIKSKGLQPPQIQSKFIN